MTYCAAITVNDGLVFMSDSRTNAGVDQLSTYSKMFPFEVPGELPVGDVFVELALLPLARRGEVVDEGLAEPTVRDVRIAEALGRLGERPRELPLVFGLERVRVPRHRLAELQALLKGHEDIHEAAV